MLTRADKWLIGSLILLGVCGILSGLPQFVSTHPKTAEIFVDGILVRRVQLRLGFHEVYRIGEVKHYNIIEIQDDQIRIQDADCPDQVCVKTGWIHLPPQQIVCLPWRVLIKIVPDQTTDIDDIAR